MQKTFFDEENLKNTKIISCPKCKKEVEVDIDATELFCNECGESFELETNVFSDDFVWHPSERY